MSIFHWKKPSQPHMKLFHYYFLWQEAGWELKARVCWFWFFFPEEWKNETLRSEKSPIYHPYIIQAAPLSAITIVPSHTIFSATNCKSIKRMFFMHITPLLSYSTADFPEYLFSALLPEVGFVPHVSVHKSLRRNGKLGSYKMQFTFHSLLCLSPTDSPFPFKPSKI